MERNKVGESGPRIWAEELTYEAYVQQRYVDRGIIMLQ